MEKAGKSNDHHQSQLTTIISLLAEAINRSFNEIKSYVENRRHHLLQSLKTTKDNKLKILNDQLNVILSKSSLTKVFVNIIHMLFVDVFKMRKQKLNINVQRFNKHQIFIS
jgi:hypothetical protein